MNGTKLIIVLFLCITAVSGFCFGKKEPPNVSGLQNDVSGLKKDVAGLQKDVQEIKELLKGKPGTDPDPITPAGARLIPVSLEIIKRSRDSKVDIEQLDYFISANILLIFNDTNDKLERQGGSLVETKQHQAEEVAITIADKGTMKSGNIDNIHISFTEKNVILEFKRDNKINRFELVAVNRGNKKYKLTFENERPYLIINYPYIPNEKSIQVQGVSTSVSAGNNSVWQDEPPKRQSSIQPPYDDTRHSPPNNTRYSSIRIEGRGSLPHDVIVRYIRNENRNISQGFLEKLIDTYIREAGKEGINHDLAIAQMCYITKFLKNENSMYTHNYAGLAPTSTWGGEFPGGMEQGVRAHIHHLKGYTSRTLQNGHGSNVDPRWNMLEGFRGTIHTLSDLAKRWTQNPESYEAGIKSIIDRMHRFSI